MVALASMGGRASAAKLTPEERSARSLKGAAARWGFVVKDETISKETRRKLGNDNERMPWPTESEMFTQRGSSPLTGFDTGGSRGRWTQPKTGK